MTNLQIVVSVGRSEVTDYLLLECSFRIINFSRFGRDFSGYKIWNSAVMIYESVVTYIKAFVLCIKTVFCRTRDK